jgi:hypothetical protein
MQYIEIPLTGLFVHATNLADYLSANGVSFVGLVFILGISVSAEKFLWQSFIRKILFLHTFYPKNFRQILIVKF